MRIQTYSSFSLDELQKLVNGFCSENRVTNIQYQTAQVYDNRYSQGVVYRTKYTAMITYIDEMQA